MHAAKEDVDAYEMNNAISYESSTNKRLRNPSYAQSLAQDAVQRCYSDPSVSIKNLECRTVIGLGPGRSGSRSLSELLSFQSNIVHCEHEMIVPRLFPRSTSGHIVASTAGPDKSEDVHQQNKQQLQQCQPRNKQVKGSWGADRRLEWDVPKLARGEPSRSDEDEALWRVFRLLEQRHVFDGWLNDHHRRVKGGDDNDGNMGKPKKLGTKGWREYNNATNCDGSNKISIDDNVESKATRQRKIPNKSIIATVSSVGLAYAHEYIALDPRTKILILLRPCEEVVASFMTKSRGRNHWQKHVHVKSKEEDKVQRDKTWDNAFPNMSNSECQEVMTAAATDNNTLASTNEQQHRPEKIWAIRAYCKLYEEVANQLAKHYPDNVRVYDMHSALNDADTQCLMLKWCGIDEPVVDTCLHLNKKK